MYKELFQAFQHITYDDRPHKYYCDHEEFISVTTLIGKYMPKFRSEYFLKYKTLEKLGNRVKSDKSRGVPENHINVNGKNVLYKDINVDTTALASEWKEKSRIGLHRGNILHRYMELAYFGKYERDRIVCCDKLVNDNKHLVPIALEFVIGCTEYKVAGQFDGLFYNTLTDEVELHDYKVDEKVEFENRFETMLEPLNFLDACNGNKYMVQLNMYAYILEKYTSIKIDKLLIQNFKPKTYRTYQMPKDFMIIENLLKHYNGSNYQQRTKYDTSFTKGSY